MKAFVVPPHADFTLCWEAPEGFEVLDLARAFAERVAGGAAIDQALSALGASGGDPDTCRRRLTLEVARALLARPRDPGTHLRALGAAFAGLSSPDGGVRLRLDDLELAHGTTERLADAAAAARRPAPYDAELDRAASELAGAQRVRLWLERDQQLPAALALAARLGGVALELDGPFAQTHRRVLQAAFPRAEWVEAPARCWLEGAPGLPAGRCAWERRHPEGWAGTVSPAALLDADALCASGARALIVPFCAWDDEVLGVDGTPVARSALERAREVLEDRGVKVAGEWWVGAPGVGPSRTERTGEALRADPFDGPVGVRPFHWTRGRSGTRFAGAEVRVEEAPPDRDLWRSHPFQASETLEGEALAQALEALPRALLAAGRALSPGRLAQACVAGPAAEPERGRVGIDPDCALVSVATALDGRPGPVTYAVNLRNGVTMAVDPRLVPAVRALEAPAPRAEALAPLGGQREKVLGALLAKGVLAEVA